MSATDTSIDALASVLVQVSDTVDAPLPTLLRNEDLSSRLVDQNDGLKRYANLWDGEQLSRDEMLGADEIPDGYDIVHEAKLEWAVIGGEESDRRAAHDRGLVAMFDIIKADRTLGGVVDRADIGQLQGAGSGLVTDGVPGARGVIVPIVLTFRSSRPF